MLLDREELISRLEEIEYWPELKDQLSVYLDNAINTKDLELIEALLRLGANPNPKTDLNCHIHHLLHEYQAEKTTNGELILSIMELLLKHGANPNRVWSNNQRAYDYAVEWHVLPVKNLLEKYGAIKELREYI